MEITEQRAHRARAALKEPRSPHHRARLVAPAGWRCLGDGTAPILLETGAGLVKQATFLLLGGQDARCQAVF